MKNLCRMMKKIVCSNPGSLETILAIQALAFGLFLLLPFSVFESSQVYHVLSIIMDEEEWGLIFVGIGAIELYALHRPGQSMRRIFATISLFLWMFVDLSCFVSNGRSAAGITYFTFVLIALWAVVALSARGLFNCDN